MVFDGEFIDDSRRELPLVSPICDKCIHLIDEFDLKCRAFRRIPEPIWTGENDHKAPYPGDNGIQFEQLRPEDLA